VRETDIYIPSVVVRERRRIEGGEKKLDVLAKRSESKRE